MQVLTSTTNRPNFGVARRMKIREIMFREADRFDGEMGSWTGIEDVKILRLAVKNGLHEEYLKRATPYLVNLATVKEFPVTERWET